jgi:hypothetical protein
MYWTTLSICTCVMVHTRSHTLYIGHEYTYIHTVRTYSHLKYTNSNLPITAEMPTVLVVVSQAVRWTDCARPSRNSSPCCGACSSHGAPRRADAASYTQRGAVAAAAAVAAVSTRRFRWWTSSNGAPPQSPCRSPGDLPRRRRREAVRLRPAAP